MHCNNHSNSLDKSEVATTTNTKHMRKLGGLEEESNIPSLAFNNGLETPKICRTKKNKTA